jgi:glycosyltransferase involved in cell wall biosynthesis
MVKKNKMKPRFSIIIPTFNRAFFLQRSINSVISQLYDDWELIIVDDGSTDNTHEIVTAFQDRRIRYIYQQNSERSAARNNGILNARGEWICFLDSDDYYLPNHLQTFNDFVTQNNLEPSFLISGGFEEINGALIKKKLFDNSRGEHPSKFILRETNITPISVCIHRSCFEHHKFSETYKKSYWEDTHLWIRLAVTFPFYQLNEYTNVLAEHTGRSINSLITTQRVSDHVGMINNLYQNYASLLQPVITKHNIYLYIDRKYRMFLYQARQNKQLLVSIRIWIKAIFHRPSLYLFSELPKIIINQLDIGIREN